MKNAGRTGSLVAALAASIAITACGEDDETTTTQAAPEAGASADLAPVKQYLTDHTASLTATTGELASQFDRYFELAEAAGFDYDAMLAGDGAEVTDLLEGAQATFREANPAYEEMEGIVAGVPELAEYDVILDAGSSAADDPESAVPFDLTLADGTVLEKPGNFFFLVETSLFGTNPDFTAAGTAVELGDRTQPLPDANFIAAAASEMNRYASELEQKAAAFEPDDADALGAVVIMTPTMSEYFGQWKDSTAIAGRNATEQGFVATSRLSDIADILGGLTLVYDGIEPLIASEDPAQARQTGRSLEQLLAFAEDLRDREAGGEKFTAEQADLFGSEAQEKAEAIAGQVSQAAAQLGIELPEA